jgi:adenylate kinase
VLLGPPASGKGTAATALSEALHVPHVSTGQMFREALGRGGPLAEATKRFIDKGQLVPDDITIEIVRQWANGHDLHNGFIFDGFPRTRAQAEAFDRLLKERGTPLTSAILIEVSEAQILERMLGRLSCEACGALYHVTRVPPKRPGVCDKCGGKLIRRGDDTEETLRSRLDVYNKLTVDVVQYYEESSVLRRMDGSDLKDRMSALVVDLVKS